MSQQLRQPVRQEWRPFLDAVTEDYQGEPVTVEVVSAELGSQIQADRAPLNYIQYDDKDDAVVVSVRSAHDPDEFLEHIVGNPWKIMFDPPVPVAVRAIDIEGSDGTHTIVTLHRRELLPEGE
jgi:hypothetical protein